MKLFTVNKSSSNNNALQDCLKIMPEESKLLLYEDAVYSAINTPDNVELLSPLIEESRVMVLIDDIEARGISGHLIAGITPVNYSEFVALCVSHDSIITV